MIKKTRYILIMLMLLFLLTGCYSSEEKKLAAEYRKQGEINAINYVQKNMGLSLKLNL